MKYMIPFYNVNIEEQNDMFCSYIELQWKEKSTLRFV